MAQKMEFKFVFFCGKIFKKYVGKFGKSNVLKTKDFCFSMGHRAHRPRPTRSISNFA